MLAQTIIMLAAAASVTVDPAACRRTSLGRTGGAAWESDGKRHLSVSVDAPSAGDVSLECRIRVPAGTTEVTLSFDHAYVSFQPSGSRQTGSGLRLAANGKPVAEVTRVAGEDWIESRNRSWTVPVTGNSVVLRIDAHDASTADPLRIDLDGLRVTPSR
ncbi:MAG: hypothetical protein SGI92_19000 [Bryobacteraceae bacterium]|nr:hypothetical protein [Bryobacteraceae bacterium]